jgi:hypothetical protein
MTDLAKRRLVAWEVDGRELSVACLYTAGIDTMTSRRLSNYWRDDSR